MCSKFYSILFFKFFYAVSVEPPEDIEEESSSSQQDSDANAETSVTSTMPILSHPKHSKSLQIEASRTTTSKKSLSQASGGSAKGNRSAIKPFLCCGSQVSLVSLVDGMDLKECKPNMRKKSLSFSRDETFHESDFTCKSDEPVNSSLNQKVARRKKKEKQNFKKRFGKFRGRWNPTLRSAQPTRSSLRCDSSHSSGVGCPGTYQMVRSPATVQRAASVRPVSSSHLIDLSSVQDFDRLFPVEDVHDLNLRQRAEEIDAGIEVDSNLMPRNARPLSEINVRGRAHCLCSLSSADSNVNSQDSQDEDYSPLVTSMCPRLQQCVPRVHTQVDFIHVLMPDLTSIVSCPFYWGVMDRYEAERLLDNKPEGTFLLRDSAQEDFLFSVSFRRYNRSLHARVEQWNHRFSFDAHDPAVFSAPTVCALMEHYKDSSLCMFFEPMLTRPLPRSSVFSLKHICRSVIVDKMQYDQVNQLPLPSILKEFLQQYHYKQKVRSRRFDVAKVSYTDSNIVV